jgi:hypothetical protein
MEMLGDTKSGKVKPVYGNDDKHEALNCAALYALRFSFR